TPASEFSLLMQRGVGTSTATLVESKSTHIVLTEERALRFNTEHEANNGINRLIIIFAIY
uniref:hypothetical protein n=1 Tax=Leyella stercorea TaxID=363265 RepID=UPI003FD6EE47